MVEARRIRSGRCQRWKRAEGPSLRPRCSLNQVSVFGGRQAWSLLAFWKRGRPHWKTWCKDHKVPKVWKHVARRGASPFGRKRWCARRLKSAGSMGGMWRSTWQRSRCQARYVWAKVCVGNFQMCFFSRTNILDKWFSLYIYIYI